MSRDELECSSEAVVPSLQPVYSRGVCSVQPETGLQLCIRIAKIFFKECCRVGGKSDQRATL